MRVLAILSKALIIVTFIGVGIANAQLTRDSSVSDVQNKIPGLKCNSGASVFIDTDLVCVKKETHLFKPTETMSLFFLGGKLNGVVLEGPQDKAEEKVRNVVKQSTKPMTTSKSGLIERWQNSTSTMYLVSPNGMVIIGFTKEVIASLDLRYNFKSELDPSVDNLGEAPSDAQRPDALTVFGIEFGRSQPFVECPKEYAIDGHTAVYRATSGFVKTCYEKTTYIKDFNGEVADPKPWKDGYGRITFSATEQPQIGISCYLFLIGGNVEGMQLSTAGVRDQDSNLGALTGKFGAPTTLSKSISKNLTGAQFETFLAIWLTKDYKVVYKSTDEKLDSGTIKIFTTAGQQVMDQQEIERKRQSPGRSL